MNNGGIFLYCMLFEIDLANIFSYYSKNFVFLFRICYLQNKQCRIQVY